MQKAHAIPVTPHRERSTTVWEYFLTVERSLSRRYAVAVVLAALSLVVIDFLNFIEHSPPIYLGLVAVVGCAIYGGRGPALVGTAITAISIDYYFTEPRFQIFDSWAGFFRVFTFAIVGYVVAHLATSLRDAYRALRIKQQEAELAKRAREDVLAIVSHDLRSPLSAILMNARALNLMTAGGDSPAFLVKAITSIHRSAEQMHRLTQDLLDAVRIEAGQFRIERAPNDMRLIINDAVENVRSAADASQINIAVVFDTATPLIYCDQIRITQVFSNLLGNAIKFSPPKSTVSLTVHTEESFIQIDVKNDGPGIPAKHLPLLFKRWQAQETAYKGTGLGLFIAKSIIDSHAGKIDVRSQVGIGTTFSVSIPIKTESLTVPDPSRIGNASFQNAYRP